MPERSAGWWGIISAIAPPDFHPWRFLMTRILVSGIVLILSVVIAGSVGWIVRTAATPVGPEPKTERSIPGLRWVVAGGPGEVAVMSPQLTDLTRLVRARGFNSYVRAVVDGEGLIAIGAGTRVVVQDWVRVDGRRYVSVIVVDGPARGMGLWTAEEKLRVGSFR